MTMFTCKVWDGDTDEWVELGVFSTCAKAMGAGGRYIAEKGGYTLIDWDHSNGLYLDWYEGAHCPFTRVVREVTVDERLA